MNAAGVNNEHRIFVGIGSNIERARHIKSGIACLGDQFGPLLLSSVYESKAFGFEGDNFFNLVAGFSSNISLPELVKCLKEIEIKHGREQTNQRFKSRTLDIDLLLYGDMIRHDDKYDLPREDILIYAFVLRPLAEIAGDERHPESGQTYKAMWENFNKTEQKTWKVKI